MKRLSVEEWEQVPLGANGLTHAEVDELIAAWRAATGNSDADFFSFGRGRVQPQNWTGIVRSTSVELEVVPRGVLHGPPESRQAIDRNLGIMLERVAGGSVLSGESGASGEGGKYDAVVRALVNATFAALRSQRPRRYVTRRDESRRLRGRVSALRTDLLQMRRPGFIASEWVELSDDTPELRFVKGVLTFVLPKVTLATRRRVEPLLVELEQVSSLGYVTSRLAPTSRNAAWAKAINIACDVLDGRVAGLLSGSVVSVGEVIFTPALFEEYVAVVLGRYQRQSETVRSQVERTPGTWVSGPAVGLSPEPFVLDVEIAHPAGTRLVLDTKWKRLVPSGNSLGIQSSDLQQMIAYASVTRCANVALVYPRFASESSFDVTPILEVGGAQPVAIRVYCLPMAAADFEVKASELAARIRDDAA